MSSSTATYKVQLENSTTLQPFLKNDILNRDYLTLNHINNLIILPSKSLNWKPSQALLTAEEGLWIL